MLIYVDESGKPQASDTSEYSVLVAMALQPGHHRKFCRTFFNLKKEYWGVEEPIGPEFELKGRELLRKGRAELPKTIKLMKGILNLCHRYRVRTFATIVPRPSPGQEDLIITTHITLRYMLLLESINEFMAEVAPTQKAIIVFDERTRQEDEILAEAFAAFLFRHQRGKRLRCLCDTPFFADSAVTPGLEIVDIMAYCVRCHHCGRRPDIRREFYEAIKNLQFQSKWHPRHVGFIEIH